MVEYDVHFWILYLYIYSILKIVKKTHGPDTFLIHYQALDLPPFFKDQEFGPVAGSLEAAGQGER